MFSQLTSPTQRASLSLRLPTVLQCLLCMSFNGLLNRLCQWRRVVTVNMMSVTNPVRRANIITLQFWSLIYISIGLVYIQGAECRIISVTD